MKSVNIKRDAERKRGSERGAKLESFVNRECGAILKLAGSESYNNDDKND